MNRDLLLGLCHEVPKQVIISCLILSPIIQLKYDVWKLCRSKYCEKNLVFVIEICHEIMSYLTRIEKIDLIHEQIMFYVKIQWIIRLIL